MRTKSAMLERSRFSVITATGAWDGRWLPCQTRRRRSAICFMAYSLAANRDGGPDCRSGNASLDQEKAGGRYAAGLVLQLPARESGSVALQSVDLIGSTGHLFDAIAHAYGVTELTLAPPSESRWSDYPLV